MWTERALRTQMGGTNEERKAHPKSVADQAAAGAIQHFESSVFLGDIQ